jgi:hypothetical protein
MRHEERYTVITSSRARRSTSMLGCCLRRVSRSTSIFSSSLSWMDLTVEAVHSTTPRLRRASMSFSTVPHPSSLERSKTSVNTRLRMIAENVARSVAFDCSRSACGIVWSTSISPSPSMSASIGPTTVVLPPPMSICLTSGCPLRTAPTNSWIKCTCVWRSRILCVNSKSRNRGSYCRRMPSDDNAPSAALGGLDAST